MKACRGDYDDFLFRSSPRRQTRDAKANQNRNRSCAQWEVHLRLLILLVAIEVASCALAQASQKDPSVDGHEKAVTDDYFGTKIIDSYRWMEASPSNPHFISFLKEQNQMTQTALGRLAIPRGKLLARIQAFDATVLRPPTGLEQAAGSFIVKPRLMPPIPFFAYESQMAWYAHCSGIIVAMLLPSDLSLPIRDCSRAARQRARPLVDTHVVFA